MTAKFARLVIVNEPLHILCIGVNIHITYTHDTVVWSTSMTRPSDLVVQTMCVCLCVGMYTAIKDDIVSGTCTRVSFGACWTP